MADAPAHSASVKDLLATGRWKIQKEMVPLPKDRKEVVKSIGDLLDAGKVQKLVVQVGEPIRVERLVPRDPNDDSPVELAEDDYVSAARNGLLEELEIGDDVYALEALFQAFSVLSGHGARAVTIIFHSQVEMASWLGFDGPARNVREIFGATIRFSPEIPDDTALLAGNADQDDPFIIVTHSVKIPINIQKEG